MNLSHSSLLNLFPSAFFSPHYPSNPYYFPIKTNKPLPTNINSYKFQTSHTHPTIEFEDEENPETNTTFKTKKKKKKLRPGFYDQTHERWSLKIASPREKFPWQEKQEKEKSIESSYPVLHPSIPLEFSDPKGETENPQIRKSLNFPLRNRVISAPWVHGTKERETQLDSENQTPVIEGEKPKSIEFHGESEKTIVGVIVEKLKDFDEEQNYKSIAKSGEFLEGFGGNANRVSLKDKSTGSESNVHMFEGLLNDSEEEQNSNYNINSGSLMGSSDYGVSIRFPWEREGGVDGERWRKSNTELAERAVPEPELRRLRNYALRMKERMKVGAAGITQAVVDEIHDKWREEEVVKIKFEGPPALNMKRTHEVLERRTGGLVIWRCGSSLVLYRGMTYTLPCVQSYTKHAQANHNIVPHLKESSIDVRSTEASNAGLVGGLDGPSQEFMDIIDVNNMLDELGPRFQDWSGIDPVPVDADLLPSEVPGYKPPFRLLPYGMRHCLRNRQMTSLRRLARKVPPHFALGSNRQRQGLAMAMVKLWEKSAIAKIAIKRGVPNTRNERMAEELKKLTGGTLVSRNKDYIVFYRGNDFLSSTMKEVLVERKKLARLKQDEEEQARLKASALIVSNATPAKGPFVAGTLAETVEATSRWGSQPSSEDRDKMMRDAALDKHTSLVRYLEKKLSHAKGKFKKAEKALQKVQDYLTPAELPTDLETITDEERFLFRKIGLSMKPFLLLGRRGVFDGTVENMHLHWKYRELVKIIVKRKSFAQVKHIAISLEAESGGLLISLDKTSKGYAIIVYRGKNYNRPHILRPKNLLTRRQALARSIELQRREALTHHILDLRKRIDMLKAELEQMDAVKEMGDENLYSQLNDAYSSDDDLEDEGEEAYLEIYHSGDEDSDSDTRIEELLPK
ncbi:CRM-domain containing factor CFM3, chloroplastic/mitochondrial-like [Tasmannia lanceolata]|uniref:CRM-domain containing factor CFM3, chloroplastic/mitochondrial-like n=1 Tax=Tasmannia lanceolata TaxID=3420 RepID=UPI004064BC17